MAYVPDRSQLLHGHDPVYDNSSHESCTIISGVFRISVRRRRGAVGVEGVGCGEGD